VLRTNAKVTPLQAVLRYRDLLQVENLFLRTKAIMRTRPPSFRDPPLCWFIIAALLLSYAILTHLVETWFVRRW
jgi:hypothetical protein